MSLSSLSELPVKTIFDFHSNVPFCLIAKADHALMGTFASHDEILSLWWSELLQRIIWQYSLSSCIILMIIKKPKNVFFKCIKNVIMIKKLQHLRVENR